MVWRTAKMNDSTILQRKNKFKAAWEPKIIYIYMQAGRNLLPKLLVADN